MNWVIVSWVFVGILTAVNVFFFMKVIYPSMKMMKQMGGMDQIQKMMGGMNRGRGGQPDMSALMGQMNNPNMQAQMKKAMDMLAQMQKNSKR